MSAHSAQPAHGQHFSIPPILVVFLGMVTAFDAMAIDVYLPAFPNMAGYFGVEPARIQTTLAIFLLGLALGQALFGPLLDRFGRRRPLLVGIALFTAGSAMVAAAPSLSFLMLGRFVQAIGGAAALIAPRAIVRDLCDERVSARIFSMLMQIVAITPLLAPMLGSFILDHLGWRAIFWTLAAVGGLAWVAGFFLIPETLAEERRAGSGWASTLQGYAVLLKHKGYLRDALVGGMMMAALFAYISGSPFVFTQGYGVSPGAYSLLFGGGGLVMIMASQANIWLLRRYTLRAIVRGALVSLASVAFLLLAASLVGAGLAVYAGLLWSAIACMSLMFGNNVSEAMSHFSDRAGSASALLGVIQYALGALAGAASAALLPDPRVSVAVVLAAAALAALVLDIFRPRPAPDTHTVTDGLRS